ncbi:hypothetical protein JTF08_08280 [Micrococcaceae bacterium RIT802]|nr:hypothetical protein [Micrococcaceae bacterium RIT 802]
MNRTTKPYEADRPAAPVLVLAEVTAHRSELVGRVNEHHEFVSATMHG